MLPVNQSIEIVIVEGNMNWLMSHQSFNCQQKVICLANLILAIQRLVVVLVVDCNALEHASDLDYIPEVPVV